VVKVLYDDLTQRAIASDGWSYFLENLMFFLFYLIIFSWLFFAPLSLLCKISIKEFAIAVLAASGILWMTSRAFWLARLFPLRVRQFVGGGNHIEIIRGVPFSTINFKIREGLKYDLSWGNFRLDLNQRGNAPRGLNIWFDYRGQRFWIPEASANYREALYGLAEHALLKFDPTLCHWERRWFWGKWRECRKRPELEAVIAEIHRILAGEQTRPEPEPEPVKPDIPVIPPEPIEPSPESLASNLDAQKPVGEEMAVPTIDGLRLGNATVQLRDGKVTLIIPKH